MHKGWMGLFKNLPLKNLPFEYVKVSHEHQIEVSTCSFYGHTFFIYHIIYWSFQWDFWHEIPIGLPTENRGPFSDQPIPLNCLQEWSDNLNLGLCTFQSQPHVFDTNTSLTHTNMFNNQVKEVYWAMKYLSCIGVDIVVEEIWWPFVGILHRKWWTCRMIFLIMVTW